MPIKNLPLHLRPREKALEQGIDKLSDIELLALFLRNGTQDQDVLSISKKLFELFGSLHYISQITSIDLQKIKGIGKIKSLELLAIFELTRRIKIQNQTKIDSWEIAANLSSSQIKHLKHETFLIYLLDSRKNLIFQKELFVGQDDNVHIQPKSIISYALKYESKKFYCIHNHPSGDHQPSDADKLFTKRLKYYCDLFGITLLGHIVVSEKGYSLIQE